jgi:glycosyltransferase involved in cell wall biosynthesis
VIRVCLIAPKFMTGGQAVEARTLVQGFRDDPLVRVSLQPIDPSIPDWLAGAPGLRTLIRLPLYYGGLLLGILRADVVHVFTAAFWPFLLTTTPAILLGRILGRPVILNYRDGRARDHLRHRAVRWILRRATVLVFPSGFLRDLFAEFGLPGVVISNVVDTTRFVYRRREPLRPVLISSRLLEELYAVENTILAHAELRRSHPDARLLVVGDGDRRPMLEALVRDQGIGGVEFTGRVPHEAMGEWFDRADILVNSSRIDNMPHCLIEAFAAGLPVVTTGSGGIPYIVEAGVNGLHVDVDQPAEMAAAVRQLLAEPKLAGRLVEEGRRAVADRYSWEAAKREWVGLYSSLHRARNTRLGRDGGA